MSPTSYRTAPPRDNNIVDDFSCLRLFRNGHLHRLRLLRCYFAVFVRLVAPPRDNNMNKINKKKVSTHFKNMEEEEGFEPPRDLTPLSVFKTDPFSQTWVFLRDNISMVDLAGLEPATGRL
jgi:hypothetical protein